MKELHVYAWHSTQDLSKPCGYGYSTDYRIASRQVNVFYGGQAFGQKAWNNRHNKGTNAVNNRDWKIKSEDVEIFWHKKITEKEMEKLNKKHPFHFYNHIWRDYDYQRILDKYERETIAAMRKLSEDLKMFETDCANRNKLVLSHYSKGYNKQAYNAGIKYFKKFFKDNDIEAELKEQQKKINSQLKLMGLAAWLFGTGRAAARVPNFFYFFSF